MEEEILELIESRSNFYDNVTEILKTIILFILVIYALPIFFIGFLIELFTQELWIKTLKFFYKNFEFSNVKNIRTEHESIRNSGVLHFLLKVTGRCDIDVVRNKLLNSLIKRKDKFGKDEFVKLKSNLMSVWGKYAWKYNDNFDINNHLFIHKSFKNGRKVNEKNIQEFLNEIIQKNMPLTQPQWQFHLVPIINTDFYYILIRIHHLIMEEERNLYLNQFLFIKEMKTLNFYESKANTFDYEEENMISIKNKKESPFLYELPNLKNIAELCNRISLSLCNRWNEFIYRYDPLESPDGYKKQINGLSQFFSIIIIMIVTIINDFRKNMKALKKNYFIRARFLWNLINREIRKRNLNLEQFINSFWISLNPYNIFQYLFYIVYMIICFNIKIPYYIYMEFLALKCYTFKGSCQTNTITGFLFEYVPLVYKTLEEIYEILIFTISYPKFFYEDLSAGYRQYQNPHCLQTISLRGRKILSWSEPINKKQIIKIEKKTGFNEMELILSAISYALENDKLKNNQKMKNIKHSRQSKHIHLMVNCIPNTKFFQNFKPHEGFLILNLNIENKNLFNKFLNTKKSISNIVNDRRKMNFYAFNKYYNESLMRFIPVGMRHVFFKYYQKIFSIKLTEITEMKGNTKYMTAWGHELDDFMYFNPPQPNMSVSLTIQRFGKNIRLGVIGDCEISPNHMNISKNFTKYFHDILT